MRFINRNTYDVSNRYAYCAGDPVGRTDLNGHSSSSILDNGVFISLLSVLVGSFTVWGISMLGYHAYLAYKARLSTVVPHETNTVFNSSSTQASNDPVESNLPPVVPFDDSAPLKKLVVGPPLVATAAAPPVLAETACTSSPGHVPQEPTHRKKTEAEIRYFVPEKDSRELCKLPPLTPGWQINKEYETCEIERKGVTRETDGTAREIARFPDVAHGLVPPHESILSFRLGR
jgi:hypothetical protein